MEVKKIVEVKKPIKVFAIALAEHLGQKFRMDNPPKIPVGYKLGFVKPFGDISGVVVRIYDKTGKEVPNTGNLDGEYYIFAEDYEKATGESLKGEDYEA